MKKTLLILTAILSISATTSIFAVEQLDKIVAVVNDDVVTQSEFDSTLRITKAQMEQQNIQLPSEAVLHKQVLDQVINKKIQLQVAKNVGINIADTELDRAVDRIAKQNNITDTELYARINQEGYSTSAYRGELREQLTIQKLQQQEVVNHIVIPPEEVTAFLNSKAWQDNGNNEYHVEDILVPVSDAPSTNELENAKAKATALVTKLKNGANFKTLAQQVTVKGLNSDDLGWRSLAEIPSAFGDEVVHMKKDGISDPIQTANGYHILHLVDVRKTGETQPVPDRKQVENFLMQRKFEEAVQNWVSKLRGQAYIVVTQKA